MMTGDSLSKSGSRSRMNDLSSVSCGSNML